MRNDMEKDIKSVTEMLQLGACNEADIEYAIQFLVNRDIATLSDDRLDIAKLYHEILKQISMIYSDKKKTIPDEIMNNVRVLFDNIQGICSDPKEDERQEVSFSVIEFLSYLRQHNSITGDNDFSKTQEAIETVNALRADLGSIQFIFDLKVDEKLYFPIENMLVSVINDEQFVNDINNIDIGHIKVLYLAVHFFDEEEHKKQILTNIVTKCHLKFVEYMQVGGQLLDTVDLHNYRKNGVITFIDFKRKKILIRHSDAKYFAKAEKVQHELSYKNDRVIGYYVEQDFPENAKSVTFDEVMQTFPEKRMELLKLFYSGYKNILGSYYLFEKNGTFFAVNPFSDRDKYVIDDAREIICDDAESLLERYYNLSVKISASCVLNRLTVGTIAELIKIDELSKKKVFEVPYNEEDFYQNQLIRNWLSFAHDKVHAMRKLTDSMYMELEYCIRRKAEKNNDGPSIEKHQVSIQKFLPLNIDVLQLLYILDESLKDKQLTLQEATIKNNRDGVREFILLEEDPIRRVKESEVIAQQLSVDELGPSQKCYVVLDENDNVYLEDQQILKAFYGLQNIMRNCLYYDTAKEVDIISYNRVKQGVKLHESGLQEGVPEIVFSENCFEDQICYRLIHNMIYSGIHNDNVKDYLKIFAGHQLLDFQNIKNDENFQMEDETTLYFPKDSLSEDSTLGNIYTKYLKKKATRDSFKLYNPKITYDIEQQKYMLKNNVIRHIVFLSDNFERGSGTNAMLSAYLNLTYWDQNAVENVKGRLPAYKYSGKNGNECQLDFNDVIKKNQCDITVHAYYGTEEARTNIKKFLLDQGYDSDKIQVSFQKAITRKMSQIKENVKAVWKEYNDKNNEKYAVIREFNMTKANVFPKEMLQRPEMAICLYLLKDEKRDNYRQKQYEKKTQGIERLKQYFRNNGIKQSDERTNTELYLLSTLPPDMRIEVLEDYLQQECNLLVLDKLSKAYGKADQLEKLKERLTDWVKREYIDQYTANMFQESAEVLNKYAGNFPIAKSIEQAEENYKKALSVVTHPVDGEFMEIMQSIFEGK